jgi:DNA-binding protein YbaB
MDFQRGLKALKPALTTGQFEGSKRTQIGEEKRAMDVRELEREMERMLAEVRESTERVDDLRRSMERRQITGYAGNGEVTVQLLGSGWFTDVSIDPEVVRQYRVEDVCALVLEAVNDGLRRLHSASQATFAPLLGGETDDDTDDDQRRR